jgi:hypothetical protein
MDLHKCICALNLGFLFMTVIRRKPFLNLLLIFHTESMLSWLRARLSNQLAATGEEWAEVYIHMYICIYVYMYVYAYISCIYICMYI